MTGVVPPALDFSDESVLSGQANGEVFFMSYVSPAMRNQFESLSIDLKNEILSRDVTIHTLQDLIDILQVIVDETEATP